MKNSTTTVKSSNTEKHTRINIESPGQSRVVIEGLKPEINSGRYPVKRTVGEFVDVEADIFCDGHDKITALLLYRLQNETQWKEVEMEPLVNDRWAGRFQVTELTPYVYTIIAWIDHFKTWRGDLKKRSDAGKVEPVDLQIGANMIEETSKMASSADKSRMLTMKDVILSDISIEDRANMALSEELAILMARYSKREHATQYPRNLKVNVDRERARFSTWYEFFPRSTSGQQDVHGTFKDCEERLRYVAEMGFDVVYFPPIHPVGKTNRKGKNNSVIAEPGDVGCPWAIGGEGGGHKAVLKDLGTIEEFESLVKKASGMGIEIALDIAFQCSPDHPYAKEHPDWFKQRPDGTIQYAENPPKKYEDIYPFDFECDDWQNLWLELKSIFEFWIAKGVKIFRVDNPHTKPFRFWEWVIAEIRKDHPEILFLSEAFTRPRIMENLAKRGFTQSYTYFAWRNTKAGLYEYFQELTQTEKREYFRPNLWPNTPDILTEYLQNGGRAAFLNRLVLAATLGASYGIYGPAFELCENIPREHGSEEYLDSEKYQLRAWDINRPDSLREVIAVINRIRKENPALQSDWSLQLHPTDNDNLVCYSKHTPDQSNVILVVVNLDPFHTQGGWVDVPVHSLGVQTDTYQVHDLLSDARYMWHGTHNYVELNPFVVPAHILRLKKKVRTERDFEYFM